MPRMNTWRWSIGYLNDNRFVKYYDDAAGTGATQFLTDAIDAYHAKC